MKSKLNLTIDTDLLLTIRSLARKKQISICEIVGEYFKVIAKPLKCKNIIDLVESLPAPKIDKNADLKDLFYQTKCRIIFNAIMFRVPRTIAEAYTASCRYQRSDNG